jgi:hypothetical protein
MYATNFRTNAIAEPNSQEIAYLLVLALARKRSIRRKND